MPVAAGYYNHIIKGCNSQGAYTIFKTVTNHPGRLRKSGRIGKIRPVVHHTHVKPAFGPEAADRQCNMPATEDDQPLLWENRFPNGKLVFCLFGGYSGKASSVGIGHRCNLGEAARNPGTDASLFSGNHGFQCHRMVAGNLFQNLPIIVFHILTPSI